MGLKSDNWILDKSSNEDMINPFLDKLIGDNVISYGLSSYGYDIRIADKYKIFTNLNSTIVDPKKFDNNNVIDFTGDFCIIPPNSFALGSTIEYIKIPKSVLALCVGKSTYARCGIIVNITPLEPEFEGHITIEISNTTSLPAKIYSNEGIAQIIFFEGDEKCNITYKERKGKYQNQKGITLPKISQT